MPSHSAIFFHSQAWGWHFVCFPWNEWSDTSSSTSSKSNLNCQWFKPCEWITFTVLLKTVITCPMSNALPQRTFSEWCSGRPAGFLLCASPFLKPNWSNHWPPHTLQVHHLLSAQQVVILCWWCTAPLVSSPRERLILKKDWIFVQAHNTTYLFSTVFVNSLHILAISSGIIQLELTAPSL